MRVHEVPVFFSLGNYLLWSQAGTESICAMYQPRAYVHRSTAVVLLLVAGGVSYHASHGVQDFVLLYFLALATHLNALFFTYVL